MSAKSLPSQENKRPHVWAFIGLGSAAVILTITVGVRGYYAQKDAATQQARLSASLNSTSDQLGKANEMLFQTRLSEERIKGELDGLSMSVGKLSSDGVMGAKSLAGVLHQMSTGQSHATGIEPSGIEKMTNKQLQEKVIAFANDMRQFSSDLGKQSDNRTAQLMNQLRAVPATDSLQQERIQKQWQQASMDAYLEAERQTSQKYYTLAIMYRDELIRRLGPQSPQPQVPDQLLIWNSPGGTSSTFSLDNTAHYLETLARSLPD